MRLAARSAASRTSVRDTRAIGGNSCWISSSEICPWITVRMKDSSGTVTESAPVLTEWAGGTEVAFSGNCAVPDPEGVDPCVASLTVEFELQPSLTAGLREISWSVDASMHVLGFAAEGLTGTVEIHPL